MPPSYTLNSQLSTLNSQLSTHPPSLNAQNPGHLKAAGVLKQIQKRRD
ncbi:hypothetical protein HMPREF3038_01771 [Akkermansia sp. KLE1797]|nr:hypothetical protein HMPREF3038_01771 [Akkermansia sp. KLE1797]KXU53977.1 hypothetical protein HMPREF3039_01932 [Akkermansia sp. KLE1798]KZA03155.1 hypothetical protein HMPREF1326_03199 [Akkermansia sp. KLE1605]